MNQGLGAEWGEEFPFHFQARNDFGVRVASDRVLQRLRAPFFWDVVSRHWEIGARRFGTALCSFIQESNAQWRKRLFRLPVNVANHLCQHRATNRERSELFRIASHGSVLSAVAIPQLCRGSFDLLSTGMEETLNLHENHAEKWRPAVWSAWLRE